MIYQIEHKQSVKIGLKEAWSFFSSPKNLALITPEYLNFEFISGSEHEEIYPGQIIIYKIKPIMNISMTWMTEITHVVKEHYFVDEQRIGPYKIWHHEHHFISSSTGTDLIDRVTYTLPFGPLGRLLHFIKIRKDVENIFTYRKAKLVELFE